jgi:hypothetical protein
MLFENYGDLRLRLKNSIIRYNGHPIFIMDALGTGELMYKTLEDLDRNPHYPGDLVHSDDPGIDIDPVPLGYVNLRGKDAQYFVRVPWRRYRHGLTPESMSIMTPVGQLEHPQYVKPEEAFSWVDLSDTIRGRYPYFEDILEWFKHRNQPAGTGSLVAFDRECALNRLNLNFHYKGMKVGQFRYQRVDPDDYWQGVEGRLILDEDYRYLKETLEEREELCENVQ